MSDTLMGIVIVLVVVGIPLSLGVIAARRMAATPTTHHTPRRRHPIMSHPATTHPSDSARGVVHVPVPGTGADTAAGAVVPTVHTTEKPDTNAADGGTDWEMPRISRRLSDRDLIVLLAMQKTDAGKDRFSANDIYGLVKGPRAEVLRIVRELRQPSEPQYRPYPNELAKFAEAANGNGAEE